MVQLIIFFSFAEHSVRLSEYVYRPVKNNTDLCDPDGFQWKRNVTVSMVITGDATLKSFCNMRFLWRMMCFVHVRPVYQLIATNFWCQCSYLDWDIFANFWLLYSQELWIMDQISNKSINSGKDTTEFYGRCMVFLVENIMFHPRFFKSIFKFSFGYGSTKHCHSMS